MKWIIIFYQVFVTIPDGEIVFSGLENGNKLIKTDSDVASNYNSLEDCEKSLIEKKGKNKIIKVDSFYKNKAIIVTDKEPLINKSRLIVNAFQCLKIE